MQIDVAAAAPASPDERRDLLLQWLAARGRLVAAEVAAALAVSEDTVRRDLNDLAARGLLQRVHGGALPPKPGRQDFSARAGRGRDAKGAIAARACGFVRPGDTVILDSGTTVLALAEALPHDLRATVVTTSLPAAMLLADRPGIDLVMIGGRVAKADRVTTGVAAYEAIRRIRADLCLIGICSLDAEAGLAADDVDEAEVKRAMIEVSRRAVALVTSDKIGVRAPFAVAPAAALADVVTDGAAPEAALAALAARGVTVTVA